MQRSRIHRPGKEETSNLNYVWVRTDVAEAIWNNNGTLPSNWKPSRKRGRNEVGGWGWCRAYIVQSSNAGVSSSPEKSPSTPKENPYGSVRLRNSGNSGRLSETKQQSSTPASRIMLVTLTIDDNQFAPRYLQQATISLSYNTNDQELVCSANTWWNTVQNDVRPPRDLTSLAHLHEPAVVYCLWRRYQEDQIYTYTGKILLALNPFQALGGLYGEDVMERYWLENPSDRVERPEPHIYAIAQDAYQCMLHQREDQSILVSGESGSGKTVTTKIIMGYLATLSQRLSQQQQRDRHSIGGDAQEGVEAQVLQSNPILESFGNARTVRNDNSSRFGKFMELLFSRHGSLVSASIETYLLEKVRLIGQAPGERNYHIFYELLAGVSQRDRQTLCIANKTIRDFRMTACSGTFDRRDGVNDRDTYRDLQEALDTVGFNKDEQHSMLAVTCALLHTSNLTFGESAEGGEDACELIQSNPSLRSVIQLLGVPVEALSNAMCLCEIRARDEVFYKNLSAEQATKAVEAFIKATYAALFRYIVCRINASIAVGTSDGNHGIESDITRIGVLDIFGFESFERNSFEQLCINYCNEALQQQFNSFVFKLEQEEYEREGIEWSFITFPDNQEMLDLIEKKRDGILSILDEHCRVPRGTDKSFCQAMYDKCQDHPRFSADNGQKALLSFAVHHYAGVVTYTAIDFLEKNKDELPKETTDLLMSSSLPFLAGLGDILSGAGSGTASASSSPTNNGYGAHTHSIDSSSHHGSRKKGSSSLIRESVGGQFSRQLRDLRNRIDCTSPHYVRCLKPNDDLVPRKFEAHIVADQLRCAGVLEAIRVSRVGFPHRYIHGEFLHRYDILLQSHQRYQRRNDHYSDQCLGLIETLSADIMAVMETTSQDDAESLELLISQGVQIGYSKVFLQKQLYEALEFLRAIRVAASAITIQRYTRRFQAECYFFNALLASVVIQCYTRRFIAMKRVIDLRKNDAALRIQTRWRCHRSVQHFYAAWLIGLSCQRYWRGGMARRLYRILAVEYMALRIQRSWRKTRSRLMFLRTRTSAIVVQSLWRRKLAIRVSKELRREARDLDSVAAERDRFRREALVLRQELEKIKQSSDSSYSAEPAEQSNDEMERLREEVERLQYALTHKSTTLRQEQLELGRLQGQLAQRDSVLNQTKGALGIDNAPSTDNTSIASSMLSKRSGWLSRMFSRKDTTTDSQVSTSSFSPIPVLQRAWSSPSKPSSTDQGYFDSPVRYKGDVQMNLSAFYNASPANPVSTTSTSLLDTEDSSDARPLDSVPESNSMAGGQRSFSTEYSQDAQLRRNLDDSFGHFEHDPVSLVERHGVQFEADLGMMHQAISNQDMRQVESLCSTAENLHDLINESGERGRTALHISVLSGNVSMTRYLIEKGAIANAQDHDGETALHSSTSAPMTKFLLEEGKANPNIPSIDGVCALHLAVQRRDIGSVRSLLEFGAKVNAADNIRWFTSLHLVSLPSKDIGREGDATFQRRARMQIANLLCSASASPAEHLNEKDQEGNSPLHYAVQIDTEDACDVINVFLEKGADANVQNNRKQPPLLLLCHNDILRKRTIFQECLHEILFHGADPNHQSMTGCTPLHLSLYHRDIDSAVQLINKAAELHLIWKKPNRWTAFWDEMGTSEVLPLDMVQDENSLHRILAAITRPPKLAPSRPWCMHCRESLGTFGRAIFCRHCSRNVCGSCTRTRLNADHFPKSFEIFEASWVCMICEKILLARKEENSSSTHPVSTIGEDDF